MKKILLVILVALSMSCAEKQATVEETVNYLLAHKFKVRDIDNKFEGVKIVDYKLVKGIADPKGYLIKRFGFKYANEKLSVVTNRGVSRFNHKSIVDVQNKWNVEKDSVNVFRLHYAGGIKYDVVLTVDMPNNTLQYVIVDENGIYSEMKLVAMDEKELALESRMF